ncbi:acyl carrier protein [Streptomyces sp. PA5.6]|uniref:acyl carrier protein n=1 Tax=Streptomyces sp. PA5.6 TaxID=3035651 RepID=UPI00390486A3
MWDERFEDLLRQYLPFLAEDEELTENAGLRDLGMDSLGTVELLSALENMYDLRFEDDALTMASFETPGILWKTLTQMREAQV